MKIAVLVVGEMRFLSECISSMNFLYDKNVDIYFSVWSNTSKLLPLIDVPINSPVLSKADIERILNRNVNFLTEDDIPLTNSLYKYVHRLDGGVKLIESSGIDYEYILTVRPDLYFHRPLDVNSLCTNSLNHFYAVGNKLGDTILFAHFKLFRCFIRSLTTQYFKTIFETQYDWHSCLYIMGLQFFDSIKLIETWASVYRHPYFWNERNHEYDTFVKLEILMRNNYHIPNYVTGEDRHAFNSVLQNYKDGLYDNQLRDYFAAFGVKNENSFISCR